jgi:MFS family permease
VNQAQPRAWVTLALAGAVFFLITAATFTSLGVVLPSMIAELHWNWSEAGTGFALLGVFCGITSYIPAWLIRRVGVRVTLVIGSLVMAVAFLCLAQTRGIYLYYFGSSLAGLGFTLLGVVPGTYLLARCFERPSFAFGVYFTIGGLGGVAGPLTFLWILGATGNWRNYWIACGAAVTAIGLLAAILVDVTTDLQGNPQFSEDQAVFRSSRVWTVASALRTPQFAILAAAYTCFLLCGITVNSISVAHLAEHGVAPALAGGMLSVEALINAVARTCGGSVGDRIEPKRLLALSLAALVIGILALTFASGLPLLITYAAGVGVGYGLTFFASTILLLNYFGRTVNLELFSIVNLISTLASIGPLFAGWTRDGTGSFVPFLLALTGCVVAVLCAVVVMRPPAEDAPERGFSTGPG